MLQSTQSKQTEEWKNSPGFGLLININNQ